MLLKSTLLNYIYHHIQTHQNTHIIIAYSGGIDSQVLLHCLSTLKSEKLNYTVSVCHVNHGLSSNALEWENFAQQQCALFEFPLDIFRVKVKAKAQHSLEELARDARYNAIKSLVNTKRLNNVLVLTGHHADDQAETFLLALKRGSGVKGLSAMKPEMAFGQAILARPLLNIPRSEIEAYARLNELLWIEDESNEDVKFDRNFLRHQIMPTITKRWPSFLKTINRSAEHCQEAEQLLTELATLDLESILSSSNALLLTKLQGLSQARFNNVIRYFLTLNQCLMPSAAQLLQLNKQLFANKNKTPEVKVGDHWLRRYKQHVYLTSNFKSVSEFSSLIKPVSDSKVEEVITLPDNLGELFFSYTDVITEKVIKESIEKCVNKSMDEAFYKQPNNNKNLNDSILQKTCTSTLLAPTLAQQVTIRFEHNNPVCTPDFRQHSRTLKKILQELVIPPWQRKRLPFVYYNEQLVAVMGYFVCKEFIPNNTDERLNITWIQWV